MLARDGARDGCPCRMTVRNLLTLLTRFWRRERRTIFEAPNDRHESLDERLAIPGPPPGIGELKNLALPICPCSGIFHVTAIERSNGEFPAEGA